MKKSIQNRIRKGLFPEMPQSFADRLTGALKIGGALNADQRSAEETPIAQVIPERPKRRFPFGKIFNGVAAAVLAALCIVIAVFGIILPNVQKTHGATHPDGYRADFPVGRWTLTAAEINGVRVNTKMLGQARGIWLEFTDDGDLTHGHDSGKMMLTGAMDGSDSIREKFLYRVNGNIITAVDEKGKTEEIVYDPKKDTLAMAHDYNDSIRVTLIFSYTPDAVIPALTTDTASDLAGKWTRTRSKYASQGTDYSWIDVDMESWQSWLEITADGHAHLTEYDSESGEALHADFSVAIGSDGIQTDWESCTGMWYDTAADTICMEIVGRRRDYYSRTPDAVIPETSASMLGSWYYSTSADVVTELTIEMDGSASFRTYGNIVSNPILLTYTVENGLITFTGDGETFTAVYWEAEDTLYVRRAGVTLQYRRASLKAEGTWTMTEIFWDDGRHASAEEAGVESTLTFQDGTMTDTWDVNGNATQMKYRYLVEGNSVLLRANSIDVNDPEITYDPETDTLRLFTSDDGRTCVFVRTPDVVIPTPEPEKTDDNIVTSDEDLAALRAKYPEYFGLDTESGLKVFVAEFACDYFSCALLSGKDKEKTLPDISLMRGTTVGEMLSILLTYDIPSEKIEVIPYVNPLSSYAYNIDALYTSYVTWKIKGGLPYLDAVQFDLDGDGREELCTLTYGPTSGLFTVVFSAYRDGKVIAQNVYNLHYGELYFEKTADGLRLSHTYSQWADSAPQTDIWLVSLKGGRIVWTNEKTGEEFSGYWGDESWNLDGKEPASDDMSEVNVSRTYLCVGATAGDRIVPTPWGYLSELNGLEAVENDPENATGDFAWVTRTYHTSVPDGQPKLAWGELRCGEEETPAAALRLETDLTDGGEPVVVHFALCDQPMEYGFLDEGIADAGPLVPEPTAATLFYADWDEDGVYEYLAYLKLPEIGKCLISDGERTLVLSDCVSVRGFYSDLDSKSPYGNLILSTEAADGSERVYELHPEGDAIVIGKTLNGYCFVDDGTLTEDEPYDLCIGEPSPFGSAYGYYTVHGDALTQWANSWEHERLALEFDGIDIQRDRDRLIKEGLLLKLKRDLPCTLNGKEGLLEAGTYVYLLSYLDTLTEAHLCTEDGRGVKVTMNGDADDLRIDGIPVSDYFDNAPKG